MKSARLAPLILLALIVSLALEPLAAKNITKTKELTEKFIPPGSHDFDVGEHLMINMLIGAFSGGAFGVGSGLAVYEENNSTENEKNLILYGGIGAGAGAIAGGLVTFFEYRKNLQFDMGTDLMNHGWYGALGGAMVGSLAGLIPYSSSKKTQDVLNYTGYGTMAGLAIGLGIYFGYSLPRAEYMKLDLVFNPRFSSYDIIAVRRF